MRGRPGRAQRQDPVVCWVGEMDVQIAARADCADIGSGNLNHEGKVSDQFAAAPEFAARSYPLEIGMGLPQPLLGAFQQGCGAMHMARPFALPTNGDALQNLCLQGRPKPLTPLRRSALAASSSATSEVMTELLV